ncbi:MULTISPECIES: Maf family protein [Dehalococcoides]|uniref:dTTP/UTP pyrophosphatase n=1 Tax=Dehalococcoides mccartyi TaxID=61435 RepID=A0AB38Z8D9_9CHLR|nr:Maf family protein [Dehalococcoides mccartyi]OBW61689.1 MAG: septum formation protein Maf [Dehalococcoides mccartyi]WRO06800.1 Maf family protein [Dehalococcoides mccartyi]
MPDCQNTNLPEIILASASPRRQQILREMGFTFSVCPSQAELHPDGSVAPAKFAALNAETKARDIARNTRQGLIIAADTVVVDTLGILGKPASPEEALNYLLRLGGKSHTVISGICLINTQNSQVRSGTCQSSLHMRPFTPAEAQRYVESGLPMDKAGAYGIQDREFEPVEKIEGCYLNVVGLPACTLVRLIKEMGFCPELHDNWQPEGDCTLCRIYRTGINQTC